MDGFDETTTQRYDGTFLKKVWIHVKIGILKLYVLTFIIMTRNPQGQFPHPLYRCHRIFLFFNDISLQGNTIITNAFISDISERVTCPKLTRWAYLLMYHVLCTLYLYIGLPLLARLLIVIIWEVSESLGLGGLVSLAGSEVCHMIWWVAWQVALWAGAGTTSSVQIIALQKEVGEFSLSLINMVGAT